MTTPPTIGQEPWGEDLNAHLASLETRIATSEMSTGALSTHVAALDSTVAAQGTRITTLETQLVTQGVRITGLEGKVAALEAKKEHVYNSYAWKFSVAAPPALAGELRLNDADPTLATQIDVRKIDSDGADRTPVFMQVSLDDAIRVNDWDDASKIHRYRVTGPAVIGTTNVQIPVVWTSGGGSLPTSGQAKINVGFLLSITI